MSAVSFPSPSRPTIRYHLQTVSGQVKLRLWEPVVVLADRPSQPLPYLYLANFTFSSIAAAEDYLRNHLLKNGAIEVPENNFPKEGAIEILPYPTWS